MEELELDTVVLPSPIQKEAIPKSLVVTDCVSWYSGVKEVVSDVSVTLMLTARFCYSIPAVSVRANCIGICCATQIVESKSNKVKSLNRNTEGIVFIGYIVQYKYSKP